MLQGNYIGHSENYNQLYNTLRHLKNLTYLNLNELQIGDKGLESLGNVMENFSFLEELHLDSNKITLKDIKNHEFFEKQKKLKVLSISNNEIDEKGCFFFSSLNFKSLERLILANNQIKSKGLQIILQNLKEDNNLIELNVANNKIDKIFEEKEEDKKEN